MFRAFSLSHTSLQQTTFLECAVSTAKTPALARNLSLFLRKSARISIRIFGVYASAASASRAAFGVFQGEPAFYHTACNYSGLRAFLPAAGRVFVEGDSP